MRAITGYAVRRCSNSSDVADLVSETFLVGLEASSRYRPESETALPWLFGIARRVLARQRRKATGMTRLIMKNSNASPSFTDSEAEAVAAAIDAARDAPAVQAAIDHLTRAERDVFELVAFDGLSPSEAAVALDLTPNAARLRLSRARRHLRQALADSRGVSLAIIDEVGHA